ncbi:porin PorA family protein [Nocardia sp. NPDC057227]|uniref:porin PorA family protein n=1 Tax=Nocardia sp. NPDC057227 TaxID=3346056 RepID=UPI003642A64B
MTLARRILISAIAVAGIVLLAFAALAPTVLRDFAVRMPTDIDKQNSLAGTGDLLDRTSIYDSGPIRIDTALPLRITAGTVSEPGPSGDEIVIRNKSLGTKPGPDGSAVEFSSGTESVTVDRADRVVVSTPEPMLQSPATAQAKPAPTRVGTYFTFPANTPRADVPYFDTATQTPVTARYVPDERTIDGLETVHFHFEVIGHDMAESPAVGQPTRLTLPASKWGLADDDEPVTLKLYYTMVQDIWVEPVTGSVLDTVLRPRSYFAGSPDDPQAVVVYTGELRFTPETVASLAQTAGDGRDMIRLIFVQLPIAAGISGVLLIALAVLLAVRGRRRAAGPASRAEVPVGPVLGDGRDGRAEPVVSGA